MWPRPRGRSCFGSTAGPRHVPERGVPRGFQQRRLTRYPKPCGCGAHRGRHAGLTVPDPPRPTSSGSAQGHQPRWHRRQRPLRLLFVARSRELPTANTGVFYISGFYRALLGADLGNQGPDDVIAVDGMNLELFDSSQGLPGPLAPELHPSVKDVNELAVGQLTDDKLLYVAGFAVDKLFLF